MISIALSFLQGFAWGLGLCAAVGLGALALNHLAKLFTKGRRL